MAVMEYCSPMGIPIRHSRPQQLRRKRRSSLLVWRMGYFFLMYTRQARPDTPWEITVARAAPATPILAQRMRAKSSPMFSTEDRARKYTGVLLSPSERMMPASRL